MYAVLFALLFVVGCAPTLVAPPLAEEGQTVWHANPSARVINFLAFLRVHEPLSYEMAAFSVSPDILASLVIATAQAEGWRAQDAVQPRRAERTVPLIPPWSFSQREFVHIAPRAGGAGSEVCVGEGTHYLRPPLLEPLRQRVQAYLRGEITAAVVPSPFVMVRSWFDFGLERRQSLKPFLLAFDLPENFPRDF